jgi:hypothetical protein
MRRLALLLLLALVTTACQIRVDTSVTVRADESGTFAMEIGLDEEFRQLAEQEGGGFDLSEGTENLPTGWQVETFVDGEFEGSRISTEFSSFAELDAKLTALSQSSESEGSPEELIDNLEFSRDGEDISFRAQLTQLEEGLVGDSGGELGFEGMDPTQLLQSLFQIRFLVTLPGTINDHNADTIDGNTLIWNIPLDGSDRTLFATSTPGGGSLFSPMVLAALAVLVLGAGGYLFYRRQSGGGAKLPPALTAESAAMPESLEPVVPVDGDPFAG